MAAITASTADRKQRENLRVPPRTVLTTPPPARAKAAQVNCIESDLKGEKIPKMNKVNPLVTPIQRLCGPILRIWSLTLCETSSPRGGTAGKTYPGNFELDALKKRNVKAIQQARYRPGEFREYSMPGDHRKSFTTIDNIGVHGMRAKSAIGT